MYGNHGHAVGETLRYTFGLHRTDADANRVMSSELQRIRAKGWVIHETGIDRTDAGMYLPWANIERTAASEVSDVLLHDMMDEEEEKSIWPYFLIGGISVVVIGGIIYFASKS